MKPLLYLASLCVIVALGCSSSTPTQPPSASDEPSESERRAIAEKNMGYISIATVSFADAYFEYPSALGTRRLRSQLSWRVALLPFLEQVDLFKKFRQDEPWDSPHNKKLLAEMPDVYKHPKAKAPPGHTFYRGIVGTGMMSQHHEKNTILDGTGKTLVVVEATEAVPWTKPDELDVRPGKPLPKIGGHWNDGTALAAWADGSIFTLRKDFDEAAFRAAVTPNGEEAYDVNLLKK